MFKVTKKKLTRGILLAVAIFFIIRSFATLESPILEVLRQPFMIVTGIKNEVGAFFFFHHNFMERLALTRENEILRRKIVDLDEVALENARLRNLLSFKQASTEKMLAARVIGYSADSWSSVIVIDRGRKSGVRKNAVVMTYLGLVGRVLEASDDASKVLLVSDPNLSVSSYVQRSRQEGLISGTLGNLLVMKYLPKDADIQAGDTVLTSGLTEMYPKGIMVGTVVDVIDEPTGLSRYATVKPAASLSNLEEVLVLIP